MNITKEHLIDAAMARLESARAVVRTRKALESAVGGMRVAREAHAIAMQDSERALIHFEQVEARLLVQDEGGVATRPARAVAA